MMSLKNINASKENKSAQPSSLLVALGTALESFEEFGMDSTRTSEFLPVDLNKADASGYIFILFVEETTEYYAEK